VPGLTTVSGKNLADTATPGRSIYDARRREHALRIVGKDGVTKLRSVRERGLKADAAGKDVSEEDDHSRFVRDLFEHHGKGLLRYLGSLLRHSADAEDVLQETYLRLLKGEVLDRTFPRARAYAFKIATNLAYDRFRRREDRSIDEVNYQEEPASAWDSPEIMVDFAATLERIEQTLVELKPRSRRVFLLRTSEGLSYEEIAATLGISKRTVEREMKHALDAIERRLRRLEVSR
jgi:RNA polymerase sigma factor (sigma-70 family)